MTNAIRQCLGCGQSDDHPMHQVIIPPDHSSVFWHLDCHAQITKCEICVPVVASANGKRGEDLRDHILA